MKKIIFTVISAITALTCMFAACTNDSPDTVDLDFDVPATEEQWIKAWEYADSVKKIHLINESKSGHLYLTEDEYRSGNYTMPDYTETMTQNIKIDLSLRQGRNDVTATSGSSPIMRFAGDGNKLKYCTKNGNDGEWEFGTEEIESEAAVGEWFYNNYAILPGFNASIATYGGGDVNLKNAFNDFTYNAETNEFSARYSGEYRNQYDSNILYDYNHAEIEIAFQFKNGKLNKVTSSTVVITTHWGGTNINVGTTTIAFPDYGSDEIISPELLQEQLALT